MSKEQVFEVGYCPFQLGAHKLGGKCRGDRCELWITNEYAHTTHSGCAFGAIASSISLLYDINNKLRN